MNTAYLIYQAERTRTAAEQREVDATHAELAASLTRLWRSLAAPLRSRRRAQRGAQHQPPSCLAAFPRSSRQSGGAAAQQPDGGTERDGGERHEDAGLDGLEGPEPAGRLVGDHGLG